MLVTTILNKVEKHKGFVYEKARMVRDEAASQEWQGALFGMRAARSLL